MVEMKLLVVIVTLNQECVVTQTPAQANITGHQIKLPLHPPLLMRYCPVLITHWEALQV